VPLSTPTGFAARRLGDVGRLIAASMPAPVGGARRHQEATRGHRRPRRCHLRERSQIAHTATFRAAQTSGSSTQVEDGPPEPYAIGLRHDRAHERTENLPKDQPKFRLFTTIRRTRSLEAPNIMFASSKLQRRRRRRPPFIDAGRLEEEGPPHGLGYPVDTRRTRARPPESCGVIVGTHLLLVTDTVRHTGPHEFVLPRRDGLLTTLSALDPLRPPQFAAEGIAAMRGARRTMISKIPPAT
jgi:hypothetical protein